MDWGLCTNIRFTTVKPPLLANSGNLGQCRFPPTASHNWDNNKIHNVVHRGTRLSEQHTDLLSCYCTKQDLSHTSRYADKSSPEIDQIYIRMPTACLSFRSVVYAWSLPKATSTTVVIKICTICGQPAIDDLQQTRNKLPCVLQLQSSQLQITNAALWQ